MAQMHYRWRNRCGIKWVWQFDDAKRLVGLKHENQPMKRIVADKDFEIDMSKELNN
jgi:hypothetical protein